MRQVRRILIALLFPSLSLASCIPFDQARNHLDETQCITGKVIRVQEGDEGAQYLDFCEDYRLCTFTVVVFPYDLKKIGDLRQLAGKVVEIRGEVKEFDNGAEIVLENSKQLSNGLMRLSPLPKPLPKSFDVEQRGHFSVGNSRRPRSSRARKKKGIPTLPANLPEDPESD
jgi:DNA/RNA endonuclease YhcR with UshA esterase domain